MFQVLTGYIWTFNTPTAEVKWLLCAGKRKEKKTCTYQNRFDLLLLDKKCREVLLANTLSTFPFFSLGAGSFCIISIIQFLLSPLDGSILGSWMRRTWTSGAEVWGRRGTLAPQECYWVFWAHFKSSDLGFSPVRLWMMSSRFLQKPSFSRG